MFEGKFRERSRELELIDGSEYGRAEYLDCLADLRRVNRYLGGHRSLAKHLFPMIRALKARIGADNDGTGRRIRLLDIGTGSADIPRTIVDWARAEMIEIDFVVVFKSNGTKCFSTADTVEFIRPVIMTIIETAPPAYCTLKTFDCIVQSNAEEH